MLYLLSVSSVLFQVQHFQLFIEKGFFPSLSRICEKTYQVILHKYKYVSLIVPNYCSIIYEQKLKEKISPSAVFCRPINVNVFLPAKKPKGQHKHSEYTN